MKQGPWEILGRFGKVRLSGMVALSALAGYLQAHGRWGSDAFCLTAGIFFAAGAGVGLNQIQERRRDALMTRTRERPLPSGRLSSPAAWILVALLALPAAFLLSLLERGGGQAILLAGAALAWYNGVYTYLKRVTTLAVMAGTLTGMMPPVIGWLAGGGDPGDPRLWRLALLFAWWQLPHCALLLVRYRQDYAAASFPTLDSLLRRERQPGLLRFLVAGTGMIVIALTWGQLLAGPGNLALAVLGGGIIVLAWPGRDLESSTLLPQFRRLNLCLCLVMLILLLGP